MIDKLMEGDIVFAALGRKHSFNPEGRLYKGKITEIYQDSTSSSMLLTVDFGEDILDVDEDDVIIPAGTMRLLYNRKFG